MKHPTITAATLVHAAPLVVYEAFADLDQLTTFWFPRATGTVAAGETVTCAMGHEDDARTMDLHIVSAMPGDHIAFDWGDESQTRVDIRFAEKGPTTELTITETGYEEQGDAPLATLLDRQGLFNQLVIAAKAWAEQGVALPILENRAA
ncbi:SRPBCC domain-containing protein [uncultured Maritimibacter sp.]|jgi:uncharacterized protein YndB with AHSA1/START domain|uniref:SRPBCC domain-containing protein n=1 Tax=uncultured Maritimibacter sp. TaxID=991866 RepID=UPI00260C12DE|nr:SRPBCC domain-containing protein [uncultured Maritimibacter sp.]